MACIHVRNDLDVPASVHWHGLLVPATQGGVRGSIVIHPRDGERHPADREQVVVLSDWTDENPNRVAALLRSGNEWYSIARSTHQTVWGALRRGRLEDFSHRG